MWFPYTVPAPYPAVYLHACHRLTSPGPSAAGVAVSAGLWGGPAAGLVAGGALGVVWVAVGAEVGGVVAAWSVGSESVDVVDVGGEGGAVGFTAEWVG